MDSRTFKSGHAPEGSGEAAKEALLETDDGTDRVSGGSPLRLLPLFVIVASGHLPIPHCHDGRMSVRG